MRRPAVVRAEVRVSLEKTRRFVGGSITEGGVERKTKGGRGREGGLGERGLKGLWEVRGKGQRDMRREAKKQISKPTAFQCQTRFKAEHPGSSLFADLACASNRAFDTEAKLTRHV